MRSGGTLETATAYCITLPRLRLKFGGHMQATQAHVQYVPGAVFYTWAQLLISESCTLRPRRNQPSNASVQGSGHGPPNAALHGQPAVGKQP